MANLRRHFGLFLIVTLSVICIKKSNCLEGIETDEYKLFNLLFQNYSKSVRPTKQWSDLLNVDLKIKLRKIANVAENHQTVTLYVRFEANWNDANLIWDPKKFDQIKSLVLPANKVWIPDLHLFNSASEDDRIYPINVEVFSNGNVRMFPINQLYAHCGFDFAHFPYDSQTCDFFIGSMVDKSKVNVSLTASKSDKLESNIEWKFTGLQVEPSWSLNVPGAEDSKQLVSTDWSVTKFTIKMKRYSSFYVNLFIWPLIFILILTMSIFILPPNCVERVTMGSLFILTLVIMSLMLDSYTPKSSARISVAGKLIGFTMFMVSWSTVFSTLIISIDKDMFSIKTIPLWLKNLLLYHIGSIVCKKETLRANLGSNPISQEEIEILDTNSLLRNRNPNSSSPVQTASSQVPKSQSALVEFENAVRDSSSNQTALAAEQIDLNQAKSLLVLINNQLANFRIRINEKDLKELNKKDWYLIACTLDRFCLLVYTVILVLGLFIVFV